MASNVDRVLQKMKKKKVIKEEPAPLEEEEQEEQEDESEEEMEEDEQEEDDNEATETRERKIPAKTQKVKEKSHEIGQSDLTYEQELVLLQNDGIFRHELLTRLNKLVDALTENEK